MQDSRYFGTYLRFRTTNKTEAGNIIGADGIIGSEFTIDFRNTNDKPAAWLINKWGKDVGYFDEEETRELRLMAAHDWEMHPLLALVAYSDPSQGDYYWGEVCVICNSARFADESKVFCARIGKLLGQGIRPDVNLSSNLIDKMLDAKGEYVPAGRIPKPEMSPGTVTIKSRMKMFERFVEAGRAKKWWMYVLSLAFIAAVIAWIVSFFI